MITLAAIDRARLTEILRDGWQTVVAELPRRPPGGKRPRARAAKRT